MAASEPEIRNKANIELKRLFELYHKNNDPIEVNLRSLVDWVLPNNKTTHFIHPYPAKLLSQIPNFFLSNDILSRERDLIFDPFCGSGTSLLEANLNNRYAMGIDVNPLAALISRVKTNTFEKETLEQFTIKLKGKISKAIKKPDVVNLNYWFDSEVIKELSKIKSSIEKLPDSKEKDFFKVCFSVCIKKLSHADPNIAVPVKLKENIRKGVSYNERVAKQLEFLSKVDIEAYFFSVVSNLIKLVGNNEGKRFTSEVICADARTYNLKPGKKFSLIITSPPYAGAQKYVRATSLHLGWLDFCKSSELTTLERQTIGREHYPTTHYKEFKQTGILEADQLLKEIYKINPLRAHIASNYLLEMQSVFKNSCSQLKKNGYFILVIGNNIICGKEFDTQKYLEIILNNLGLTTVLKLFDTIKSRGLMTKRNKTASMITREWIIIFQKR